MANLTFQSGAHQSDKAELSKYALFLGGLNVTRGALEQYDPLRTGYGRLFMIRKPVFLTSEKYGIKDKLNTFKHILEYANIGVSGNNNITMNFNQMQGGYTNRQMDVPNIATDDSNEFTVRVYEFSGSPVREVIQMWINGMSDIQSGFAHYNGAVMDGIDYSQANHTAEFIYVVTDPSGTKVEYAALFANCMPKEIKLDHFNYDSGQHDLVQMDVAFTCTRYMSPVVNDVAARLIKKYSVLVNSLNFNPGFKDSDIADSSIQGSYYDKNTGKLKGFDYAGDNADKNYEDAYYAGIDYRSKKNTQARQAPQLAV